MANINQMIADLDQQISSLQTARDALASAHGVGPALTPGPRRTTPFKSALAQVMVSRKKRTMSPEAREKIAAAQRLRWARTPSGKKAAPKKVAPKKAQVKKVRTKWPAVAAKKKAANRRPKAAKQPAASQAAHQVPAQAVEPVEVS